MVEPVKASGVAPQPAAGTAAAAVFHGTEVYQHGSIDEFLYSTLEGMVFV
jgi:hypothetical protein